MHGRKSELTPRKRSLKLYIGVAAVVLITSVIGILVFRLPEKKIEQVIRTAYSVEDPAFRRSISHLLGPPLIPGNQITELVNGDQIFPAMFKGIREATRTITFETFIWHSGKLSDQFIEALSERAKAGVKVHIVADAVATTDLKDSDIERMRAVGIQFVRYNPPRGVNFFRVNHRTHRKLLVIDGKIGFIGGVCLADEWTGNAEAPPHWRESHYRVEGPVVAQMQGIFMENWLQTQSEVLHGDGYFPDLEPVGAAYSQAFESGPLDGAENARLLCLYSFAAARKSIRLAQGYFVPDNLTMNALLAARKRGVKVEIIAPSKTDANTVRRASRSRWPELLAGGVEMYEFQPTYYHCKFMIVDDIWVSVGSVNIDDRSFRINDEANLNVLNRDFAARQLRTFEEDKSKSRRILESDLEEQSTAAKCKEWLAGLFRWQL